VDFNGINEIEIFKLNTSAVTKIVSVGELGRKVIIIDDFYKYPEEVIKLGRSCPATSSKKINFNSPGWRSQVTLDLGQVFEKIHAVINEHLENEVKELYTEFNIPSHFTMNWIQTSRLPIVPIPHIDSIAFAGLVYFNQENLGGTGFFRHKLTGLEYFPSHEFEIKRDEALYRHVLKKHKFKDMNELLKLLLRFDDENEWELMHTVDFKFNRLVLYRGNFFHTAVLPPERIDALRITQGFFFR
jgi:hypothetical protein